jgi:hypothetical protein
MLDISASIYLGFVSYCIDSMKERRELNTVLSAMGEVFVSMLHVGLTFKVGELQAKCSLVEMIFFYTTISNRLTFSSPRSSAEVEAYATLDRFVSWMNGEVMAYCVSWDSTTRNF